VCEIIYINQKNTVLHFSTMILNCSSTRAHYGALLSHFFPSYMNGIFCYYSLELFRLVLNDKNTIVIMLDNNMYNSWFMFLILNKPTATTFPVVVLV